MSKKILVTGGAGFIGSHLIDKLLASGHTVINIDNFDSFYTKEVKKKNIHEHFKYNEYQFFEVDILQFDKLIKIVQANNVDTIVHLAAKAGVRPSISNPIDYFNVNVAGTINILEIAQRCNIKKVVFASSSSVYGENSNVPWKESDTNLKPISPYASSKISAEQFAYTYSKLYNLNIIALRFFTVYGPRQRPDLAIHKFFHHIYNNIPIPVFGDGATSRDYTYIDDILAGLTKAILLPVTEGAFDIYNLGNSKTVTLAQLISEIEKIMNKKAIVDRRPPQPGDVEITNADISKSAKFLGYEPVTNLTDGLKSFYNWYLSMLSKSE